jgi:hypothetical protein
VTAASACHGASHSQIDCRNRVQFIHGHTYELFWGWHVSRGADAVTSCRVLRELDICMFNAKLKTRRRNWDGQIAVMNFFLPAHTTLHASRLFRHTSDLLIHPLKPLITATFVACRGHNHLHPSYSCSIALQPIPKSALVATY